MVKIINKRNIVTRKQNLQYKNLRKIYRFVFIKICSVLRYLEFIREEKFLPTGVNFVWHSLKQTTRKGSGYSDQGTGWMTKEMWLDSRQKKESFLQHQSSRAGTGAYSAYSKPIRGSFPGSKA